VTYRFGEFLLDVGTRRLLHRGEERHLSPKAFDLLVTLVENRAQAMSKADLQQRLWPTTFVVETNLASLIAEIRQALGDSADDPVFVRTMHRFGYWFIGPVTEQGGAAAVADAPVTFWLLWEARQVSLQPGANILGRAPDAEVWIDAPGVSRQHARIRVDGAEAWLEDLGSKNGTYLRGKAVTAPEVLRDGDQIRLGSVVVTFRIPPAAGSTETVHR
jgi:DNA-binding winged helix-turn-helix (wHTH) protein